MLAVLTTDAPRGGYFCAVPPAPALRPATAADVPALAALVNRAYRGEASRQGWTTEADLLDGPRIDEAALRELLAAPCGGFVLACGADAALVGCVYLQPQPPTGRLYLGTLAVAPEAQAHGIGRHLLAEAERQAQQRSCSHVKITVLTARPELVAWYERRGYARTGATEPFPADTRLGRPRQALELLVLEKGV